MLTRHIEENILTRWVDFRQNGLKHFQICTVWIWNEKQLLSVISKFCGDYCIFYCLYRCRGVDVRKVAKMFTKDTSLNDSIVHNFVCKF